jgi:hypothetical protein
MNQSIRDDAVEIINGYSTEWVRKETETPMVLRSWKVRGTGALAVTALAGPAVTEVAGPAFDTPGGCDGAIWPDPLIVSVVGFGDR